MRIKETRVRLKGLGVRIAILLVVAATCGGVALANFEGQGPDYFSANGRFVAHVPSTGRAGIDVFEVKDGERIFRWRATVNSERSGEAFVSDNGQFVVTFIGGLERLRKYPVIAIYGTNGLIKDFSLEEIFHVPQEMSEEEMLHSFGGGMEVIIWDTGSIGLPPENRTRGNERVSDNRNRVLS
jgi:hypothetical protein